MDRPTPAARFAAKVNTRGPWALRKDCPGPCHLWEGATTEKGYGAFYVHGRTVKAHRYAVEQATGPIPDGLEIDHRCRRRACVNRDHLEPVTHRENVLRSTNHVAARAAVTHCPAGHAYDRANTIRAKNGTRKCRACKNTSARKHYAERRAARRTPMPTARTFERAA
ncbi:HNH endonuclease signature motif containing protein [Streptomyces sp. 8L]|uniref:HNH endonuclease signature motif containing protein n=1 Tax=Streptomyces sp. 8L TaxID=2877242 RepID=UPI001CD74DC1|nr:HNH endonuclease signature motif containing protein [Streptomyces sp. 8L]MCA1218857.1 HNH endonuclease [Streptomyces sp. 8L]